MTPYERDVVGFLDRMKLTDIRTLLNKETVSEDLELYLREYFSCSSSDVSIIYYLCIALYCLSLFLTTTFLCFLVSFCSSNDAAHRKRKEEVS